MANHFLVNWKRPRKAVPDQELNNYPATPPSIDTGFYPAPNIVTSFRVKFEITQQTLPAYNNFQKAVPSQPPVVAWGTESQRAKTKKSARIQSIATFTVKEIPQEEYPAYLPAPKFSFNFRRNHLTPEELNVFPLAIVPTIYPAFLENKQFKSSFNIRRVKLGQLNEYPATPPSVNTGFYPGSSIALSNRVRFKLRVQDQDGLNLYPASPLPAVELSAFAAQEIFKWSFKRNHIQVLPLNEYPATPAGYYTGFYPGSIHAESLKFQFKRNNVTVSISDYGAPSLIVLPPTSTGMEFTLPKNRLHFSVEDK